LPLARKFQRKRKKRRRTIIRHSTLLPMKMMIWVSRLSKIRQPNSREIKSKTKETGSRTSKTSRTLLIQCNNKKLSKT
jgi:hypothetical protein